MTVDNSKYLFWVADVIYSAILLGILKLFLVKNPVREEILVEIHNEKKEYRRSGGLVFLKVVCIGGNCGMVLFNFLFVLAQKETKKPRKNEASTRKASPGPAIFPGRRAWVANNSAVFLVLYGFVNCFLLLIIANFFFGCGYYLQLN